MGRNRNDVEPAPRRYGLDDAGWRSGSAGKTRNSRIDYIYYSKGATALSLQPSQVFDVRDTKGVMPSDHRPVMSVFAVK
jgi:exonuclease III